MSKRNEDLFPELEPPLGGTTRLLARIDADGKRQTFRARLFAATAGVALAGIATVVVVSGTFARPRMDPAWADAPGMAALGLGVPQSEPLVVTGSSAAVRVPVADPNVVFYLVGSAVSE